MQFIKLQAEKIFDGYQFLENKVLIVQPDGTVEAIVDADNATDDVKKIEGILCPGFINCHCHLELSHLKNQIPENTGLTGFVQQIVQKRDFEETDIFEAIVNAENEMLQNGIVAVGDICNTIHTIDQKQKRHLYYQNFIEAIGSDTTLVDKNFSFYKTVYEKFAVDFNQKQVSLSPHAPYSVSRPLLEKLIHFNNQNLFSIHNQETDAENEWFQNKTGAFADMFKGMGINTDSFVPTGKSSLQSYGNRFIEGQQVLLIHNIHTTQEDIDFTIRQPASFYWCFCPNANEYISQSTPNLPLFIKKNCNIVLGTDSLASNHTLDIWDEIKTLQKYYPEIEQELMLQWATINGANALKIADRYGSFEKGKKPGFTIIQNNQAFALKV